MCSVIGNGGEMNNQRRNDRRNEGALCFLKFPELDLPIVSSDHQNSFGK